MKGGEERNDGLRPDIEMRSDESNWEWCQRYAEAIDKDSLIQALVNELAKVKKARPWSAIGHATSHGSGVSQAIAKRFGLPHDP